MRPPQNNAPPPGTTTVQFAQPAQLWPRLVGEIRPPDRFPRRVLLWLLPGVLGAALLLGVFGYFEVRAAKQIVYLTGQRRLGAVRADGAQPRALSFAGLETTRFGAPHWSPDGSIVAAVIDDASHDLALLQPSATTATRVRVDSRRGLLLAGQPWSPDSAHLALLDIGDQDVALRIANVAQASTITVPLQIDAGQPLEWHPARSELLVTAFTAEQTPTLQIVSPDGAARPFAPQGQQQAHFGGVWSPDGGRVAYLVGGDVWVANSDGGVARQLVGDGLNSQPAWAPAGDAIFYTRTLTKTQGFDLYRVQADGSQPPVRIGPGLPPFFRAPAEWRSYIAWSADGSLMLFEGGSSDEVTVYVSPADGSAPHVVAKYPLNTANATSPATLPVARWSPTNRGILVSSGAGMQLYWVDSDSISAFPNGLEPSWQP